MEITAPASVTVTGLADSSTFVISLYPGSILVTHLNRKTSVRTPEGLDEFIKLNQEIIDTSRISLWQHIAVSQATFTEVIGVLRKNNIYKFQLVTLEN